MVVIASGRRRTVMAEQPLNANPSITVRAAGRASLVNEVQPGYGYN